MTPEIDKLSQCTVKVKGSSIGTGCWVSAHEVLTCFHLVEGFEGPVSLEYRVNGKLISQMKAEIAAVREKPVDLALLRITGEIDFDHPWLMFDQRPNKHSYDAKFACLGYANASVNPEERILEYKGTASHSHNGQEVSNLRFTCDTIVPGLSGAPVRQMGNGGAAGIFRASYDPYSPQGGLVIGTDLICHHFPQFQRPTRFWPQYSPEPEATPETVISQLNLRLGKQAQSNYATALKEYVAPFAKEKRFVKGLEFYAHLQENEIPHNRFILSKMVSLAKKATAPVRPLLQRYDLTMIFKDVVLFRILVDNLEALDEDLAVLQSETDLILRLATKKKVQLYERCIRIEALDLAAIILHALPEKSINREWALAEYHLVSLDTTAALESNARLRSLSQGKLSQARAQFQYVKIIALSHVPALSDHGVRICGELIDRKPGFKKNLVEAFRFLILVNNTPEPEVEKLAIDELISRRVRKKNMKTTIRNIQSKAKARTIRDVLRKFKHSTKTQP